MGRCGQSFLLIGLVACCNAVVNAAEEALDFERDIRPMLQQRCVDCHGAEEQNGGLRFDDLSYAFNQANSARLR